MTITDAPTDPTMDPDAVITFAAPDATALACTLDGGSPAPCTSPFTATGLADGPHSFAVVATDAAGNTSVPATWDWTVDTTPADVTITDAPPVLGNDPDASITFTSPDATATFTCTLDGGTPAACTSPFTTIGLADGPHTFAVTATDAAGNTGTPATWGWTIDTVAPTVTITPRQPALTNAPEVFFDLAFSEPSTTAECDLVGISVDDCSGALAVSFTDLTDGTYTLAVTATDPAGNTGPTANVTWTSDTTPPEIDIDAAPADPTNDPDATTEFSSPDPTATFTCALDGATPEPCAGTFTALDLTDGPHSLEITATDAAGNVAATTVAWTIDTAAPEVTIVDAPEDPTTATDATFSWVTDDDEPQVDGATSVNLAVAIDSATCTLDDGPAEPCSPGVTYTGLTLGAHTFAVTIADTAGNLATATHTWTITAPPTTTTTAPTGPETTTPAPGGAAPSTATTPSPAATATTTGQLPRTGNDIGRTLTIAGLLLTAGLALAAAARRRTRTDLG